MAALAAVTEQAKQMVVPSEEATRGEPPSLSSIPADVLQTLKDLDLRNEAPALEAASAWCTENEPGCLADIQGDPELISDFLSALTLAEIPERKLRAKLEAMAEEQGTFRAKYERLHLIGKGGFGITYLERDRRSDQQFASKQILELTEEEADEALKEFRVMQQLRHPTLVEALEAFCEPSANGEFTVRLAYALTTRSAHP